ncbi:MAG: hypothetical protein IKZ21_05300 [Clostridia bacterium]|nr:hypothetical protein [Clostridia bacterium]
MVYTIASILYYLIPSAVLAAFVASLVLFLREKRWQKIQDVRFDAKKMKTCKVLAIVSGVALGVMLAVVVGFILLLMTAVAFM